MTATHDIAVAMVATVPSARLSGIDKRTITGTALPTLDERETSPGEVSHNTHPSRGPGADRVIPSSSHHG